MYWRIFSLCVLYIHSINLVITLQILGEFCGDKCLSIDPSVLYSLHSCCRIHIHTHSLFLFSELTIAHFFPVPCTLKPRTIICIAFNFMPKMSITLWMLMKFAMTNYQHNTRISHHCARYYRLLFIGQ